MAEQAEEIKETFADHLEQLIDKYRAVQKFQIDKGALIGKLERMRLIDYEVVLEKGMIPEISPDVLKGVSLESITLSYRGNEGEDAPPYEKPINIVLGISSQGISYPNLDIPQVPAVHMLGSLHDNIWITLSKTTKKRWDLNTVEDRLATYQKALRQFFEYHGIESTEKNLDDEVRRLAGEKRTDLQGKIAAKQSGLEAANKVVQGVNSYDFNYQQASWIQDYVCQLARIDEIITDGDVRLFDSYGELINNLKEPGSLKGFDRIGTFTASLKSGVETKDELSVVAALKSIYGRLDSLTSIKQGHNALFKERHEFYAAKLQQLTGSTV